MRLPSAYQEVEYIESSGSQRIDTGITPNDATYGFECKFNITNTSGDWGIMMACTQSVNHGRFGFAGYSTSNFQVGVYGTVVGDITAITPVSGTDYEVKLNYNGDGKTSINGTVYQTLSPQGAETYSTPWTIFCYSYGTNSYARYGSFKLYYMKIYHGTTLVRELVPCYRKSNDEIGMYDTVNNTFYTNSGTGTFTKGPNVEYPPEYKLHGAIQTFHRERPYEWEPGSNTVAYYDIDDNDTTTNIYDKSGNNYTQTWSGTAGYTTDADYGRVAAFDGSSYTQASSIVDFGSEYTFISLLKTTSTSSSVQAIVLECASTYVYPIGLGLNHGGAYDLHSSGQGNSYSHLSYGTAGQQIADEWIMLVGTRDSNGNGKLYLNGNKIAEGTVAAPNYSTGEALQIGRWRNGDANYLNGQFKLFIGENRCWGDAEIKKFYNWYKAQHKIPSRKPSANTIAYFPFVDDANNHTSNTISLTNTGTKDTIGYTFTSTSTLNTQSYDTQVKYLGGWYKINSVTTTGNNGIFYIPYVGWISYNVGQQASNKRGKVCLNDSNWGLLASKDITLDLGNWHHLAYIIDGTDIKLAIDGIVYDFYNGSTPSFNSPIYLTDIASMNVTLSDFILEDKSRTEQEILAYYEGNKDKYIPEASPAFEEQTFNYSYSTGERGYSDSPTEEHSIIFDYPYDDIVVDYSFNNYGYESREWLKIYKNGTELFSSGEQTQSSGTYGPISVVAGDELKVQFGGHGYTTRYWLVTSSATVKQST